MQEVDIANNDGNVQQNYNLDLDIIDQLDPEYIWKNQVTTTGHDNATKSRTRKGYRA